MYLQFAIEILLYFLSKIYNQQPVITNAEGGQHLAATQETNESGIGPTPDNSSVPVGASGESGGLQSQFGVSDIEAQPSKSICNKCRLFIFISKCRLYIYNKCRLL